jgi:hypothetical protein
MLIYVEGGRISLSSNNNGTHDVFRLRVISVARCWVRSGVADLLRDITRLAPKSDERGNE